MPKDTKIKAPQKVVNQFEVDALKQKNTNIAIAATGISILGNVAGLLYAIQTKKSGWGKVGWFFLGGIIVGIPSGIVGRAMVVKNNTKIGEMEANMTQTKVDEMAENKHFNEGGGFR